MAKVVQQFFFSKMARLKISSYAILILAPYPFFNFWFLLWVPRNLSFQNFVKNDHFLKNFLKIDTSARQKTYALIKRLID